MTGADYTAAIGKILEPYDRADAQLKAAAARRNVPGISKATAAYASAAATAADQVERLVPPVGVDDAQASYVAALRNAIQPLRKLASATATLSTSPDTVGRLGQEANRAVKRAGKKLQALFEELSSVHSG